MQFKINDSDLRSGRIFDSWISIKTHQKEEMQRDATLQRIDQSETKSVGLVEPATYTFWNASSDQWKDGALMVRYSFRGRS